MAVNIEGGAPYAPSTAILEFINRNRNGGIPQPVTLQTLERLGISESLRPRTLQALKQLDFIDADGNLTAEFENLRKLPTPEYLPALAELLRAAYTDVFAIVDPSNASYENVSDAFRGFTPSGQMLRMVALFLALLEHTEQWENLPSPRAAKGSPRESTRRGNGPDLRAVRKKQPAKPAELPAALPTPPPTPSTREAEFSLTVALAGGAGTVTLSADVNPMKLKGDVREFFYKLVDMMDAYEQKTSGSEG